MIGIITNETKILTDALENGIIHKKPVITLGLLSKHYFKELDRNDIDKSDLCEAVFNKLSLFMQMNYEEYKFNKWSSVIRKTIDIYKDNSDRWNLVDVNEIYITKNEWTKIIELNDSVLERLAFIMLVYHKINVIKNPKSDTWINQNINDIFKEAKVTFKGDGKILKINKLYNKGYISQSMNCLGTSIKLNYICLDGENMIHIDNFNNVLSYYYEFRDKVKYRECKECGIRFKTEKKSAKKYCKVCSVCRIRESSKKYMIKKRLGD